MRGKKEQGLFFIFVFASLTFRFSESSFSSSSLLSLSLLPLHSLSLFSSYLSIFFFSFSSRARERRSGMASTAVETPVLLQVALSGASVSVANTCTIPLGEERKREVRSHLFSLIDLNLLVAHCTSSSFFFLLKSPRRRAESANAAPERQRRRYQSRDGELIAPEVLRFFPFNSRLVCSSSSPKTSSSTSLSFSLSLTQKQIKTATSLFVAEGPRAFYNGLGPALARGVFYGGTRLGLYSPLRDAISAAFDGKNNRGGEASTWSSSGGGGGRVGGRSSTPSFGAGLAAGCLSGCAAAALTK